MQSLSTKSRFNALRKRYDNIYVIVSPPRCSSTAFARVFWEQPSIRYYAHEPFEGTYFMNQDLDHVLDNLRMPLDLRDIKSLLVRGSWREPRDQRDALPGRGEFSTPDEFNQETGGLPDP